MSLGTANRKDLIGAQGVSRDGNLGDWVRGHMKMESTERNYRRGNFCVR